MRPRINPALNIETKVFTQEVYTIQGLPEVVYFKRCQAIEETRKVAIAKKSVIVILLNGNRFIKVSKNGAYSYIYNPATDNVTDNKLKSFFISRGFVMAHYGKVA